MSVHNRKGHWYCQHYVAGKLKREWFGRGDIAEQRARARDDQIKHLSGKIKLESLSVAHVCQEYHHKHLVAESTYRMDNYKFSASLLPILGHLSAECLTSADLSRYTEARIAEGVKRTTVAREIRLLKAALNWAVAQDQHHKVPIPGSGDSPCGSNWDWRSHREIRRMRFPSSGWPGRFLSFYKCWNSWI